MTAGESWHVRWSAAGRGWSVPTTQLDDVVAYCQANYWVILIREQRKSS
jgi:hypothetical protein